MGAPGGCARWEFGRGPAPLDIGPVSGAELLPVAPRSGEAYWWSNDGDGIDTTLTRRFDLTGGWTGWVDDSVDLTPYAGSEVLVRFEYVTDDAVNGRGLCLDDFAIDEIGWADDAESDGGWEANGFARVNNLVPEEFLVQIVRKAPGGTAEVTRLLLDGEADGEIRLADVNAEPGEQVAVIVSAVTREAGSAVRFLLAGT